MADPDTLLVSWKVRSHEDERVLAEMDWPIRRPDPDEDEPYGPDGEFQRVGPDGGGGWTTKPKKDRT